MDLETGPGLVAAIALFLNREDLSAQIPAFIRLAESRFNRELRTREQIRRAHTVTNTDEVFKLPTDFAEAKALRVLSPEWMAGPLDYAAPDELAFLDAHGSQRVSHFSIVGDAIDLAPKPHAPVSVELTYYTRVKPLDLSTEGATSWLLKKAPDLYLYGSLIASAPFLAEDERIATWSTLASDALTTLNTEAERAQYSGSRLNARKRTFG